MTSPTIPSDRIRAQAADWLARRDAGFTSAESTAFADWLARDPRHAQAVAELAAAWDTLLRPRRNGGADAMMAELEARAGLRRRRQRKAILWNSAALAAAAAMVIAFWLPSRLANSPAPSAVVATTAVPMPRSQTLPDGSIVELNAEAEIAVHFTAERRDVHLLRGEAHFAVTKDVARPFVVLAGNIETRAVGTAFSVRFAEEDVRVLVTEGRVAVASSVTPAQSPPTAPVMISAGTRVIMPAATDDRPQVESVTEAEMTLSLAWRSQRISFSSTPLGEAIALFNRQNQIQLAVADKSIETLRISGIYWVNDPEGFARLLRPPFAIHSERVAPDKILLRR